MNRLSVINATKADLPEAAHVLSIAITPTLNSIALWGGQSEKQRTRIEKALLLLHLNNPYFKTLIARIDGKIVGVHSMLPWPHCQPTFWEGIKMSRWMLPVTRWTSIRGLKLQMASSHLDPQKPHWHLGPIGVLPSERGRGIGRQLVTAALVEFDREGTPAYLETDQPSIVHQEEQLGFRVIGEAMILGVHNWLMWREPHASREPGCEDR